MDRLSKRYARRIALGAVLGFSAGVGTNPAVAQQLTLDQYRASEQPRDGFALSRPQGLGHLGFGVQAHLDYGNDPAVLEMELGDRDTEQFAVVSDQFVGHFGLSFGLFDHLVLFAGLPVQLVMEGDGSFGPVSADGSGLGDLLFGGRFVLTDPDSPWGGIAVQATGTVPTADAADETQTFSGESGASFHPELLVEVGNEYIRVVGNLGARVRGTENFGAFTIGDELTYGVGLIVPLYQRDWIVNAHAELYGASTFEDFGEREESPAEGTVGAKVHSPFGLVAGVAGGPGFGRGLGTPDYRIIGMLGWAMSEGSFDGGDDAGDRDGDGLLDSRDACPDEPEDLDGFQDGDGCPDRDNDGDGVPDVDDGAPLIPEDIDGFEDHDGVPDPDNDGDSLMDRVDNCPDHAGPIENQGCPDPDRDGDGLVDRLDNCPDEAGSPENHGCQGVQRVVIRQDRIEILDKVFFETDKAKIRRRSYSLLLNVAQVIKNHPEIRRVRVEGHTDSRGSDDYNLNLSRRRAEAVVNFLHGRGAVPRDRLEPIGFGEEQPIIENARRRDEHAQNRRVEFRLVAEDPMSASPAEMSQPAFPPPPGVR